MAGGSTSNRVTRLEEIVGTPSIDDPPTLCMGYERLVIELGNQATENARRMEDLETRCLGLGAELLQAKETIQTLTARYDTELIVLKQALAGRTSEGAGNSSAKARIPEPKAFTGNRNAKDLENFLWDMEQYFKAARIPDEDKVSITSMYLMGDAKLWWRTRVEDESRESIETWEALRKDLRDQFLPCNTLWVARDALKRLKQSGTVRDYVKEFSSLMLDIRNMTEEDKLFNFMSGLQSWAQMELRRQGVRDLPSAVAAADGLVDFRMNKPSGNEKGKSKGQDKGRSKDGNQFKGKKKKDGEKGQTSGEGKPQGKKDPRTSGCFICNGPHRARECPKREKLSALVAEEGPGNSDSEGPSRFNPLQLINTLRSVKETSGNKSLMYFDAVVNNHPVLVMLDTGATHNFVAERMVKPLQLSVGKASSKIKAVNSEAQPVAGMAREVAISLGNWSGRIELMVVPLDDFDIILGIDFMSSARVAVLPYLGGMLIMDEDNPSLVMVGKGSVQKGKAIQKTEMVRLSRSVTV